MFKKSRRKIVVAIMSVLFILWSGTLSIIYASSYFEMTKQNEEMLKFHAETYTLSQSFENPPPVKSPFNSNTPSFENDFAEKPIFQLSNFYTVAVSYYGDIIEISNKTPTVYSDSELEDLARVIIKGKKESGIKNNFAFYKTDKNGYILISFMDNTVLNENAITLFRYTLIFGALALVLFFFLSMYLAKKIVEPLEKSYHKQKQFISDAGHELKTPLSVVSANAEMLFREVGQNVWLHNILYENERMGILVSQLLNLAKSENLDIQTERINLSRLVAGEALPFESVAFEKGLALITEISNDITVEGNSTQLKQIVSILLDNAICHSKEQGNVKLTLTKEHSFAFISVINKGDEIPFEKREQIFERFYRADIARNSEDGHYGLGLSIAKAIASAHKGNIEVLCYNGFIEFKLKLPLG